MRQLLQEAGNASSQHLQPEGTARAVRYSFEQNELYIDHMSKRQLWVKFRILFFPQFQNGKGMPFIYCHSYRFVLLKLVCNCAIPNNCKHIASVGINENQLLGEQKNKSTLIFASSNTKDELQVFCFSSFHNRLIIEIRSKKETML